MNLIGYLESSRSVCYSPAKDEILISSVYYKAANLPFARTSKINNERKNPWSSFSFIVFSSSIVVFGFCPFWTLGSAAGVGVVAGGGVVGKEVDSGCMVVMDVVLKSSFAVYNGPLVTATFPLSTTENQCMIRYALVTLFLSFLLPSLPFPSLPFPSLPLFRMRYLVSTKVSVNALYDYITVLSSVTRIYPPQ